jgi:hypothetical protein
VPAPHLRHQSPPSWYTTPFDARRRGNGFGVPASLEEVDPLRIRRRQSSTIVLQSVWYAGTPETDSDQIAPREAPIGVRGREEHYEIVIDGPAGRRLRVVFSELAEVTR